MSTTQVLVLGALAGFTIFLGLPIGRIRSASPALKAGLSAMATGILLFLLWDVLVHGIEPVEGALEKATDDGGSWVDFVQLAVTFAVGMSRRPDEPRLLRPVVRPPAQQGDARPGCCLRCRVRPLLGGRPVARGVARAADRDGHRAAQLLRGARDRAVRGAGPGHARARPDHRVRPAQRDRGLRDRRADVGRRDEAVVEASSRCWADRRRADLHRDARSGRRG